MVTVKAFATLRQALGGQRQVELALDGPTRVRAALEALFAEHPQLQDALLDEDGALLPHVSVFVNGRDVRHLQGLDTLLREDDTLALFPPVAGG